MNKPNILRFAFALASLAVTMLVLAAPFGAIGDKWTSMGASRGKLGQPISDEQPTFDGVGRWQQFQGGIVSWHPQTGAHVIRGSIEKEWVRLGREKFGYPVTDVLTTANNAGLYAHFRALHLPNKPDGSIFWSKASGAHAVIGAIRDRWAQLGWERSSLGFPTSNEYVPEDGPDYRRSDFMYGYILWSPRTGAREHSTRID